MGRPSGSGPHGVQHELRAARTERLLPFHECEAGATHRLDAGADPELQLAGRDGVGQVNGGAQRRRAEPVDGVRRYAVGEPGSQRGPAGYVTHALVSWVDAARGDLLDITTRDADALDRGIEREPEKVVSADMRQRAAVATD